MRTLSRFTLLLVLVWLIAAGTGNARAADDRSFLRSLGTAPVFSTGTTPANGDQNPYGVAIVPQGFPAGTIHPGDILVSNFNNGANQQGTGTTIVAVTPGSAARTFFTAVSTPAAPVGLTTALVALPSGLVVVGNTPTTDGTAATLKAGSLLFLDGSGHLLLSYANPLLQGPWDMTADSTDPDRPILYVSNVLNGTVVRLRLRLRLQLERRPGGPMPRVDSVSVVGSGFGHRTDPNALVVGPTGLLLSADRENLYVADTANNRIQLLRDVDQADQDQRDGRTIARGAPLKGPLALAWSPIGTLVASNGDAAGQARTPPNMVVEIDPHSGEFISTRQLDTGTPGAIFGITIGPVEGHQSLVYVNDNSATLNVLQ